ncbi:MAG: TetR/AcrR family transcriptional regulator [Desulfovibrio sp.]|uniref:TetR/AcrR family transcriptional regulator n=1 Tax=Desulfovibrio sp. 7SRBS1 TaxID=3378064 RepID=UPI003B3D35BB
MNKNIPARERIIEASSLVFSRQGYAGAKMDAIAQAAGVNKAAIYYHIGNKKALFEALLLHHFEPLAETLEQQVKAMQGTRSERLQRLIRLLAHVFSEKTPFPRIMLHELATGGVNMSENVLRAIMRVLRCTLSVLSNDETEKTPFNPLLAHLNIVSGLMFSSLVTPMITRARTLEGNDGLLPVNPDDMADHIIQLYDMMLSSQSPDASAHTSATASGNASQLQTLPEEQQ